MNRAIQSLLLLWFVISYSQFVISAETDDDPVTVVGGVAYIFKTSDFTVSNKAFKPQYTSLDWSAVLAYKSFYTRVNFDQSIRGHTEIDNSLENDGSINSGILTLDREDIAVTFGYSLFDSISVFAGYKRGETSGALGGQLRGFNPDPITNKPVDFLIENTEVSFKENGPFIGIGYTYFTQKSGSINFSVAYADLDGEALLFVPELDASGSKFIVPVQILGDTTGLSYSLSWTDMFSEDMNYTIGINIIRYEFDAPLLNTGGGNTEDFSFDENFANFSISLTKFF